MLLVPAAVYAQSTIQGLVTDPSGAAVPGAIVAAALESTGSTRTAATGEDGRYRIVALAVGTYIDLRAIKGFTWWRDHGVFLFGIGVYNLTNHTNAIVVSPYYRPDTYRGLVETLNARQVQFSFQWEF